MHYSKLYRILIATALLSCSLYADAQSNFTSDKAFTLEECVLYAIDHSPMLQATRLDELGNDYDIQVLKAQGLPQVNGAANYNYNYALAEQLLPGEVFGQPGTSIPVKFGVAHTLSGSIDVSQTLYSKSYKAGLKAAKASQELTKINTFQVTEDLIYDILNIYLQMNLTQKQIVLVTSNIDRIEQLIKIAKIQFEEGLIKKIDVDQLLVNRTNLQSEKRSIETGVRQQLNWLKFYMGLTPSDDLVLAPYELEAEGYPLVKNLIIEENTALKVLEKQVSLSSYELENIKAGFFPTVDAFMNYGWQGQTDKLFSSDQMNALQGSPNGIVGVRMSVPIFDGFRRKNNIQKVKVQQQQLEFNRQHLMNSIEMQYDNANELLSQNRIILDAQDQNMVLAGGLYETTKLSYQEGFAPLTELLNAESSLQEAQTQYITSLLNVRVAELDHLRSSGQLSQLIRQNIQN